MSKTTNNGKVIAIIVNYHAHKQVKALARRVSDTISNVIIIDNNKINRGFAAGVNTGIKQAINEGAQAILLLNPDLIISPTQINQLLQTPGDIVGPVLKFRRHEKWVYDLGGKVNWLLGRTNHIETTDYRLLTTDSNIDYVSGACMLIRTEVFEKIGFFDEGYFMYFEDADFCLRAKKTGFSVKTAGEVVLEHAISEHRQTRDRFKLDENIKSNWVFINKWITWAFKPVAYLYLLWLWLKSR